MDYFHLSYISAVPLLYPIIGRLIALKAGARGGQLGTWGDKMGDAAIALSTRIRVVEIAVERLNKDIKDLDPEVLERVEEIDRCIGRKPMSIPLRHEEIGFRLVASLDAFLYEARSAYEMLCFWSLLKRGIVGTYHNVSKKYLPLYLHEFQFRQNNRKNPDIFGEAIGGC